jgi:hypothetical protein
MELSRPAGRHREDNQKMSMPKKGKMGWRNKKSNHGRKPCRSMPRKKFCCSNK